MAMFHSKLFVYQRVLSVAIQSLWTSPRRCPAPRESARVRRLGFDRHQNWVLLMGGEMSGFIFQHHGAYGYVPIYFIYIVYKYIFYISGI